MLTTAHCQTIPAWLPSWLAETGSAWVKTVNTPAGWAAPPGVKHLCRVWSDNIDAGYIAGGRQGGRDFVRSMYPRWQQTPATAYELANEPDCNTNQGLANLREYTLGAIEQAVSLGIRLCVLNIAEGNPHDNGTGDVGVSAWKWQQLRPAVVAAQQAGMWLGRHCYYRPGVEGPTGRWHALGRLAWDLEQLDVPGLHVLVNECGIDGGIAGYPGQQGWRVLTSEDAYRNEIIEAERYARTIPGIEALMVFGFGAQSPWESFDVPEGFARSLIAPLRALGQPVVTPPVVAPTGAVIMPIVNTHKAWYSADSLFGPYDGHPARARDWNLESMGNTDLGEPLQAPCDGWVVYAQNAGGGHGLVVSFVAVVDGEIVNWHWKHLQRADVKQWQQVKQGQRIGAIGNAYGQYSAHLHEEVVRGAITAPTQDWRDPAFEYVDPAEWYKAHGVDAALVDRMTQYDGR